jgi:hypothetical protein
LSEQGHLLINIPSSSFKILKVQIPTKGITLETLNQHAKEIMKAAPTTVERLQPQVDDINGRWDDLLKKIANREVSLSKPSLEILVRSMWLFRRSFKKT